MAGEIQELQGLERKVTLVLPWATIKEQVKEKIKDTQKKTRINGFRPGKAPFSMIESMYGERIQNDVLNDAALKAFYEIVNANKLTIAGLKRFEPLTSEEDKENFKISAIFEVFPEDIKLADLKTQEMDKVVTEITDADVEKTLGILRAQRAQYKPVKRAAKKTDQVTLDFTGKIDGKPFPGGSAENYTFVLGSGRMLPEFEAGLIGMKAGESKDVTVSFPEDYHGREVAGKTAVFTLNLKAVAEEVLPEVDADFAKSLGVADGDLDKMRAEIKENLSREVARRVDLINKEAVINLLLAAADFTAPEVMIDREVARLKQKTLENRPQNPENKDKAPDLPDELFKEQATKSVKVGLILNQLVDTESLLATPEQVKAVIQDIAQNYENPDEVMHYYLHNKEEYNNVQALATEKNVVDFVLQKIKVKEVKKSFSELMQA